MGNYKEKVIALGSDIDKKWIDRYCSEEYRDIMFTGISSTDSIEKTVSPNEIEKLVRIFEEVCDLGTKIWDLILEDEWKVDQEISILFQLCPLENVLSKI